MDSRTNQLDQYILKHGGQQFSINSKDIDIADYQELERMGLFRLRAGIGGVFSVLYTREGKARFEELYKA